MLVSLIFLRSSSGSCRKNFQFSLSGARSGGCASMLMAFIRVSLLFLAGHTSAQIAQPVQSSGATWIVYFNPFHSLSRASIDLKVAGAPASSLESYTLMRITECGHTMAHLPHWMQVLVSHTGISSARLRFSHLAVPVGNVPSAGNALTGNSSPRPAYIVPNTSRSNSGADGENGGGILMGRGVLGGAFFSKKWARVSSTAFMFFCTISSPLRP